MFSCTRCGELVTCPYFYKGGVYGYTCIDIVSGERRRKQSIKFTALDTISVEFLTSVRYTGQQRAKVVFHPVGFVNRKSTIWLEFDTRSGMYCFGKYILVDNKLYCSL